MVYVFLNLNVVVTTHLVGGAFLVPAATRRPPDCNHSAFHTAASPTGHSSGLPGDYTGRQRQGRRQRRAARGPLRYSSQHTDPPPISVQASCGTHGRRSAALSAPGRAAWTRHCPLLINSPGRAAVLGARSGYRNPGIAYPSCVYGRRAPHTRGPRGGRGAAAAGRR